VSAAPAQDAIDRVTTLELFFDLVFVFTVTQLTGVLAGRPDAEGMVRAAVMLAVIFWMYAGYAWLTNAVAADRVSRRIVLLAGMAAFLIVALAVPRAFRGGGLAFGLAYAVVVAVHTGLFTRAARVRTVGGVVRLGGYNAAAVALVIVGGALGGSAQLPLWAAAAALEWLVVPFVGAPEEFEVGVSHFVERHGLVVLVAIGESVVAIGIGLGEVTVDLRLAAVAVLGLALSACLWWTYFGGDDERAERALEAVPPLRRSRLAVEAYGHAHLALLLGVVAIAAAEEQAAHHPFATLGSGLAAALGGGAALYLAGEAAFRTLLHIGAAGPRLLAAGLALATIPIGTGVAATAQIGALVVLFLALFVAEARRTAPVALTR
jgi:low temperature requirement protein LtrA